MWDEDAKIEIFPISKKCEEVLNDRDGDIEKKKKKRFGWNMVNHCTWAIVEEENVKYRKRKI